MKLHSVHIVSLILGVLIGFPSDSPAKSFTFRKIYDTTQSLPGIAPSPSTVILMPGGPENAPAFDGRYVVFPTHVEGDTTKSQLWAADTVTGKFILIVDNDDLYPGTNNPFNGIYFGLHTSFAPFNVDNGIVAFTGRSTSLNGDVLGFLSKTIKRRPIRILADTNTPTPGSSDGNFSRFTFGLNAVLAQDRKSAVFNEYDGGTNRVSVLGGPIEEVANNIFFGSLFPPECCSASDYNKGTIVADTSNVFGTGPIVSMGDAHGLETIVSAERGDLVPNDPDARIFDNFRLQAPQIENGHVVFQGAAVPKVVGSTRDLAGLYSFRRNAKLVRPNPIPGDSLPPYAPGKIIRLVDSNMAVPGGTGNFTRDDPFLGTLAGGGFSFSGKHVFFLGRDEAGIQGLYHVLAKGGKITKIVANGDTLPDGRIVTASSGAISFQPAIQIDSAENNLIAVKLTVVDNDLGPNTFDAVYLLSSDGLPATRLRCGGKQPTIVGTEGNDVLTGTNKADVIIGLGGKDIIKGLGGNDVICGNNGNDVLDGGAGNDRLFGGRGNDSCSAGETQATCETID